MLTGVTTAPPLIWFAAAAQSLRLATLGLMQYIAPTCLMLLGIGVYGEHLGPDRAVLFGLISLALALYAGDALRAARADGRLTGGAMRNRITDIPGLRVGHAQDPRLASGVTALLFDAPVVAAVDVRGGGPGTRETDLLDPAAAVPGIDGLCLSGGSAFGLDAAAGVVARLAECGRGFPVGPALVPIVPGAILFDLLNGGDKAWGRFPPYRDLGYAAACAAAQDFALGSVGAGLGARTANLKGGLGSASTPVPGTGLRLGALAVVNAFGRATIGEGPHFHAALFEREAEFGGRGLPAAIPADALSWPRPLLATQSGANTTLAVVATDAALTKAQAKRLAVTAQDGLARALHPVHTPLDGDVVFAVAAGAVPLADPVVDLARLGTAAAETLARAVAIGVHAARRLPCLDLPDWQERFGAAEAGPA